MNEIKDRDITAEITREEKRQIKQIKQDVDKLNKMFRDFEEIVDSQSIMFETIEDNLGNIVINVKKGAEEINITELAFRRRRNLTVIAGVLMGGSLGAGIPMVLILGIKAVLIGGSIGTVCGGALGKLKTFL